MSHHGHLSTVLTQGATDQGAMTPSPLCHPHHIKVMLPQGSSQHGAGYHGGPPHGPGYHGESQRCVGSFKITWINRKGTYTFRSGH